MTEQAERRPAFANNSIEGEMAGGYLPAGRCASSAPVSPAIYGGEYCTFSDSERFLLLSPRRTDGSHGLQVAGK